MSNSNGKSSFSQRAFTACLKYRVVIPNSERRQITTRTKLDWQSYILISAISDVHSTEAPLSQTLVLSSIIRLADALVYSQSTIASDSPTTAIKQVRRSYSLHLLKLRMKLFSSFFFARRILILSCPILSSIIFFDRCYFGLLVPSGAFDGSNCILTPGLLRCRSVLLELESLVVPNFSSPVLDRNRGI